MSEVEPVCEVCVGEDKRGLRENRSERAVSKADKLEADISKTHIH